MSKLRHTVFFSITGLAALAALLGLVTVRRAWNLFMIHQRGDCVCAVATSPTWQDWILAGMSVIIIVGFLLGIGYAIYSVRRTRRFMNNVATIAYSTDVLSADLRKLLDTYGSRLMLIRGASCEAFTVGLWNPTIVLCAHCAEQLSYEELKTMLAHEWCHVVRKDPLRFLVLDSLKYMFFFLPVMRGLVRSYRIAAEIAADEGAGDRDVLGKTLLRVMASRQSHQGALTNALLVSFASILEIRIERLTNPAWRMSSGIEKKTFGMTLALFSVVGLMLFGTGSRDASSFSSCMQPERSCITATPYEERTWFTSAGHSLFSLENNDPRR